MFSQTIHKDGSFVLMNSSVIKAKCEAMLSYIKTHRAQARQEVMDENREKMKNRFFHRLFKRPDPTDQEVEDYITGDVMFSDLFRVELFGYESEAVAKRLLKACEYTSEIYVSTEDLEKI